MTTSQADQSPVSDAGLDLDEAFLERVDRAVMLSKEHDPYRMGAVHRALEEEVQRAAPFYQQRERIKRDHNGAGDMSRWEAR